MATTVLALYLFALIVSASAQETRNPAGSDVAGGRSSEPASSREQWFLRGRTFPGQSSATLRLHANQQKILMRTAKPVSLQEVPIASARANPSASSSGGWIPLGPAPLSSDASGMGSQDYGFVSGRATAIAIDPADSTGNTVFIGGAYGGVWKSTNASSDSTLPSSVTWTPLIDNQATLAVGAIAVQPGNTNPAQSLVLVGTGEANSSADSYYGLGILRSTNAGATWNLISQASTGQSFAGLGFSKIAFSSVNPHTVVAATSSTAQGYFEGLEDQTALNRGLYYSIDDGQTWSFAVPSDSGTAIVPESATSVVYAAAAGLFFAAVRFHGLYSSPDGINWSRLANQPGSGLTAANCPSSAPSQSCPIYRGEIAVVPGRNEMYAWYVDANSADQGIWQSKDGGASWTPITDSGITNCGDVFGGCGTEQGFYNLELAAVPNGTTATDLYAGAINIYKCQINSAQPNCSGTGSNQFMNLTHVYGCPPNFGSIAHVHPDQHAVAFTIASNSNQDIMYFANDGGVYRTLDGFTGLTTGTCGGSNQFDDLNQTLGSMTQFVSFSVHPSDPSTILGGAQDNGSPATGAAESSTAWISVNAGDGGYNAINASNPLEWFTANSGVSIQRCTNGISCHAQDFSMVVQPITLGGDEGAFYTPYILDPSATSSELIVGTCRVWRGPGTGGAFTALSNNFETGAGACTGQEINTVRSLAAGGPPDSNGFANVIYAGTDGEGPLSPSGGHLWVTTNATGGFATWVDRTGPTNPGHFPISSVALDPSDLTGHTAYIAVMGFHVSHVWKTSDAGVSWTDFSGSGVASLPDAPANSLVVDAQSGTVYVGTDVGVFSSSTSSPAWTEVGPATAPGLLPNVAVTALRIFDSGAIKLLRASTYGRGVWEFPLISGPDFQFNVPISSQSIFPTQTAAFAGTVTAFNGYSSQIALACVAGTTAPPSTCTLNTTTLTPTAAGAPFTLTAGGALGDYSFQLHGAGNDPAATTHSAAITLHVVDFALGVPSPASVSVLHGATSAPVNFQVTALGSFSSAVSLACLGLPTGANCSFTPAALVNPTSSAPVNASVAVTATSSAQLLAPATSAITIVASVAGAPSAKTQPFSLTINPNPDFALTEPSPFPSVQAGTQGSGAISIASQDGFSTAVALSCSPSCSVTPGSVSSFPAPAMVTVDASNLSAGNYSVTVTGTSGSTTHTLAISFTVNGASDFTLTASPATNTINAGQQAQYTITVGPSAFNSAVSFSSSSCSGLPNLSSCSFTPSAVTPSSTPGSGATVSLIISTTSSLDGSARPTHNPSALLFVLSLPFGGALLLSGKQGKLSRRLLASLGLCFALSVISLMAACGGGGLSGNGNGTGGGQPGTASGTYMITVSAVSGSLTHTAQVTLVVR
jgi:large repetitive protein